MTQLDLLIGQTQRNITYVYAVIFVLSIGLLIFLPNPSEVAKTILIASSATLGTILIMQNQFWYGRPRGAGIPDPVTTTIRTETPPPPSATDDHCHYDPSHRRSPCDTTDSTSCP